VDDEEGEKTDGGVPLYLTDRKERQLDIYEIIEKEKNASWRS